MYRGKYVQIPSFQGGYCGALDAGDLRLDQAADLDNIVLLPSGKGFRSRGATAAFNSSEAGGATGFPIIGIGYLNVGGVDEVLVIRNGKAYGATWGTNHNTGTLTDRTAAITITTSSAVNDLILNRWSFCQFNQALIGFGGPVTAPDAPIKWTGEANNIVALGGTPPSAAMCFAAMNRVFAARTAANPSTIYWSVLANAEDWTGAGSGSAVAGTLDDNEPIMACMPIAYNKALIFKRTKIYQMDLTSAPFPITLLFDGAGCHSVGAAKAIEGVVYFINTDRKMMATDGYSLMRFPEAADDLLAGASISSSLDYFFTPSYYNTQIVNNNSTPVRWLIWSYNLSATTSNTTARAVVWDLNNKCWLRCSTGFKFSASANTQGGYLVAGWYNIGKIFMVDRVDIATDDTGDNSGHIDSYWQSGLINEGSDDQVIQINRMITRASATSSGTATLTYGYGNLLPSSASLALTVDAGDTLPADVIRRSVLSGRGNGFRFKLAFSFTDIGANGGLVPTIKEVSLGGKEYGQKIKTAS